MIETCETIPLTVLKAYPETECDCVRCKSMCRNPCWPVPEDAERLMDAGHAGKLMLNWWEGKERVYVLCGANPGYEGEMASEGLEFESLLDGMLSMMMSVDPFSDLSSGCVFQSKNGMCELHDRGLKPVEGRRMHHGRDSIQLREAIVATWKTDAGSKALARWKQLVNFKE